MLESSWSGPYFTAYKCTLGCQLQPNSSAHFVPSRAPWTTLLGICRISLATPISSFNEDIYTNVDAQMLQLMITLQRLYATP